MTETSVPPPDLVRVRATAAGGLVDPARAGVDVRTASDGRALRVDVGATDAIASVVLRWRLDVPRSTRVLGDAWERAYGDLEWRVVRPEAALPWTVLRHDTVTGITEGAGVEVRGGALAFWQVDDGGLTLTLDLRSGGAPVRPGDRAIHAATVRWTTSDAGTFPAQRELLGLLCTDALATGPLVGANNWYYAYGRDFALASVVRDARTIAELADGHPVRPFGVIDDGWSIDGTADGRAASPGPWKRGRPGRFPDMAAAAQAIRAENVRPGVWFRPLLTRDATVEGIRARRDGAFALDPTAPAVRELVAADVARLVGWGYELIKHDFSTYDLVGRWGPQFGAAPMPDGPALYDPSVTTAEALGGFYRIVREAAGDALILGCNVVGHLAAGLVHAQRIGDDTSGLDWNRTRRVGVNTLAFRLAQHGAFFTADADCVASTPMTPWRRNRQFLDLVARSGTALFVSVDPATRTAEVDADLAAALRLALDGGTPGGIRPLDWMDTPTPTRWSAGGAVVEYDWLDAEGADPFEPGTAASPPP